MRMLLAAVMVLVAAVLVGCSTTPDAESGPHGTIAYYVKVESSEPGVSIETNHVYAGTAPLRLKVFGNKDGSFHNFGSPEYVVGALPLTTNQFLQTQSFRTAGKSAPGANIPGLIFFDLNRKNASFSLDVAPEN
jgi:hypothetical protein